MSVDLTKADDKDAKLTLRLRAKGGYSSHETHEISANQWAEILAVCVDSDRRRVMRAAPDLLAALRMAAPHGSNLQHGPNVSISAAAYAAICAAIAKAAGDAPTSSPTPPEVSV